MVDIWANKPDCMSIKDCHCSKVDEFKCSNGTQLYRYTVSVTRQLDDQRGLMRERLRNGVQEYEL
jgi:hypothetical protein